ncbi:FecR family protein [Steroidobacter sp.]|uniref:FecR family protein n=1 Tax=Steroidobacter sp. TaxID=1978227 RepID=UPI001A60AFEE|nr:FecR domain-containing protein [Steroidobacter sp.]MBL8266813.1 FecR domain-containing protein [Steroidobacter sp.]
MNVTKDSSMKLTQKDRLRLSEQAALRLIRLQEDTSKEAREDYLAWSRLSAHHVHEMLFAQAVVTELDGMDPLRTIDVDALPTLPELASTPLDSHLAQTEIMPQRRRHWPRIAALAASIVIAVFGWAFFGTMWFDANTYVTAVGEQRSVKLEDSSVMVLNTATRAKVEFSGTRRAIRLLEGEALFMVRHDPSRPFAVSTNSSTVVAVGTQFNVYQRADTTRVSVIEGVVRIDTGAAKQSSTVAAEPVRAAGQAARLNAGDEAIIHDGLVARAEQPDVQRAVAWRTRQLVFRDRELSEVATEFNRYNKTKIVVEGDALRARSISGVFEADDTQPLIDFLRSNAELEIVDGKDEILIRRKDTHDDRMQ